ncbi:cubilin-like [Ptychodera flava]|uniref:cubilin-like n=1 Tax=Ptychodera flava TaxID=63121 RepID=UPI003969F922
MTEWELILAMVCLYLALSVSEVKPKVVCGGGMYIENGIHGLEFNGSPGLDADDCTWTIYPPQKSLLTAKLLYCNLDFDTAKDSFEMSYIEIRDGENSEQVTCGCDIHAEKGIIEFTGSPGLDTDQCIWTIYTLEKSKVTAKLLGCNLIVDRDNGSYAMSYIEVRDGKSADDPLIGNYTHWDCSLSEMPMGIGYASSNAMWIRLVSPTIVDEQVYFDLLFDSCGGDLKIKEGSVSSPFYPDSYLESGECTWTIGAYQGTVFSSTFEWFELRNSADSVEIGNDVSNGEPDIGRYTNVDPPGTVNDDSESNTMWIQLKSFNFPDQNGTESYGFFLRLQAIGGTGGDVFGQTGYVYSPGHPLRSYPNDDTIYTWNIYSPNGTFITGTFVDFALYTFDTVFILDSDSEEPFRVYRGLEGHGEQFNTTGNKMVIELHTTTTSSEGYGRFELHFQAQLMSTMEAVSGYNGTVCSPLYPLPYPMNVVYTTKLSTPQGTIMNVQFTELKLRTGDNVSVYDQEGSLLAGYQSEEDLQILETCSNISFVILYSGVEDNTRTGTYCFMFEVVHCGEPDDVENGDKYGDSYLYDDVVSYDCHEGYDYETNVTSIVCQTDGEWSEMPRCVPTESDSGGDVWLYLLVTIAVIVIVLTIVIVIVQLRRRSILRTCGNSSERSRSRAGSDVYENHGMNIACAGEHQTSQEPSYETLAFSELRPYYTLDLTKGQVSGACVTESSDTDLDEDRYMSLRNENTDNRVGETHRLYENDIETQHYMHLLRPQREDADSAYVVHLQI